MGAVSSSEVPVVQRAAEETVVVEEDKVSSTDKAQLEGK